jgi:von Willebrand factor type A domain
MRIDFLTPPGALLGLLVLVPVAAALLRERRHAGLRRALGLPAPERRMSRPFVLASFALFSLLAVAAAQPVLRLDHPVSKRTDAEAFFVFDSSRSMLAAPGADARTRFERAMALGLHLRQAFPTVPAGVASMTDRPLPHLFPSADGNTFASVVQRSIGVDRPPPAKPHLGRATDLDVLVALARENFFSARSVKRLAVLLTDGESVRFDPAEVAGVLQRNGVALVVVRLWDAGERIYGPGGVPDPAYRPDPAGLAELNRLAAATAGGRVFSEHELPAAIESARAYLGDGPVVEAVEQERAVPLAGYLLLAAGLPLAFLLVSRGRLHTVWSLPWRGSSRTAGHL